MRLNAGWTYLLLCLVATTAISAAPIGEGSSSQSNSKPGLTITVGDGTKGVPVSHSWRMKVLSHQALEDWGVKDGKTISIRFTNSIYQGGVEKGAGSKASPVHFKLKGNIAECPEEKPCDGVLKIQSSMHFEGSVESYATGKKHIAKTR
ncbi:hypothetical protein C8J55DRAFT_523067 [Lentinula edodes]|uniref:Uncharacterized protein n=1 Tax=Lentinula lateritia TaxID=40482 RepID=A0A9W9DGU6_9AGAR|nr:hypothetical protein C8J55DRAFT_523067 [Lentinula edodes]